MLRSNILVVVVDGLRASALGAYGNTTYPTPALDSFAADSLLLDACFAPTEDLAGIYRALWQSRHPVRQEPRLDVSAGEVTIQSLPALLRERGYNTALITDESQLDFLPLAEVFHERIQLHESSGSTSVANRADDIAETKLANLFTAACEAIDRESEIPSDAGGKEPRPQFVWVHAQGMYGPWDAPVELQETLLDESDPPIEQVAPPDFMLQATDDPDLAFQYSSAYAAQVMVLDACWQGLVDAIDVNSNETPWLAVLLGARGFCLGEHRQIGGVDPRLYAEQMHVPFMIRYADGGGRLARSSALTTHMDMMPTLLEAIGVRSQETSQHFDGVDAFPLAAGLSAGRRDALLSVSKNDALSIRTSAWSLRTPPLSSGESQAGELLPVTNLFVRPDDRWEANDVAKLCPDVVEELQEAADRAVASLRNGEAMPHEVLKKATEPVLP